MSDAPWLDIMVGRIGTQEVRGPGSNPVILSWFKEIGHPEVTDDETSWCAVSAGSCLKAAGYPTTHRDVNMLARSYCTYGIACPPKRGALAIWPRGKSTWQGHINIVEEVREIDGRTQVRCVGGNQSGLAGGDAVTRTNWRAADEALAFRWPVKPTVAALRQAGSSEIKTADAMEAASTAALTVGGAVAAAASPQPAPVVPIFPEGAVDQLGTSKQLLEGVYAVAGLIQKNPWLASIAVGGLVGVYLARRIKARRVARAQSGAPLASELSGGAHA